MALKTQKLEFRFSKETFDFSAETPEELHLRQPINKLVLAMPETYSQTVSICGWIKVIYS